MTRHRLLRAAPVLALALALAGCGGRGGLFGDSALFGRRGGDTAAEAGTAEGRARVVTTREAREAQRTTLADLFRKSADPNTTVEVNKYIWIAAQDVLNFLPIETVDPFTGVIVTGYGVPPGGGQAYRATVYVQDPALDARSLRLSLQTRGGAAVSLETSRAIEDAILTRARQLRIQDTKL
jgi:hypothetical protein